MEADEAKGVLHFKKGGREAAEVKKADMFTMVQNPRKEDKRSLHSYICAFPSPSLHFFLAPTLEAPYFFLVKFPFVLPIPHVHLRLFSLTDRRTHLYIKRKMSLTQLSQHLFIAGFEDSTQCFQRYGQPLSQLCYALVETGPDGAQFVLWSKIQELYDREGKVKFVVDDNDLVPLAVGPDMQM